VNSFQNSKAIIQDGTDEDRESALQTLYSALEAALLLSHPFLPFITEELWQRLPRRPGDATESIMVASYPTYDERFDNPAAEEAYQLVLDCSAAIRSMKADFESKDSEAQGKEISDAPTDDHHQTPFSPSHTHPPGNLKHRGADRALFVPVFIQTSSADAHETATAQTQSIKALGGKGATTISILDAEAARPHGCVATAIGSRAVVFLRVIGRVDLAAEIAKATAKLSKTKAAVARATKLLADPVYQEKVAAATQEAERKKLMDLETEVRHLEETISQFEELRLEKA